MNIHKLARLTPLRRAEMARRVLCRELTQSSASQLYGVSERTVSKWVGRYKREGIAGMNDRSSRPNKSPRRIAQPLERSICELRRERLCGAHIAKRLGVSTATVSRVLQRSGLSNLKALDPKEPERRYEYDEPGEMIHLDIKKFGRFERPGHRVTGDRTGQSNPQSRKQGGYGWEYLHVCIDDHSRIAFTDIFPNENKHSAIAFLKAAIAWYKRLGITITRVMTDNGACYISKAFAATCAELGIKHVRTKPYTPRTNGKAERFIKTAITEWAYARKYQTSEIRKQHLPIWTHNYNWHRPHSAINYETPISRAIKNTNNLLRLHI